MRIYYDQDADIAMLRSKRIVVVGYGSQGHAHALNLKDSGLEQVRVALAEQSTSRAKAEQAGFQVMTPAEAASWGEIAMFLVPDEIQGELYSKDFADRMPKNAALMFAHGFNINFNIISPRSDLDVLMVAPKGPGHTVRSEYLRGAGVPCLLAVHQDSSGNGHDIGLAYAAAIGGGKGGIIATTFRDECESDLFGEQAVLCGGLCELIRNGYEVLVEAGYPAEMAYFECLHEVKLIVDLLYEGGMSNMRYSISNTAEYGDYTVGKRVVPPETKERMRAVLADIQSGKFARDWMLENKVGQASFKTMRKQAAEHEIEAVGKKLRGMMPWIKQNKLVDSK